MPGTHSQRRRKKAQQTCIPLFYEFHFINLKNYENNSTSRLIMGMTWFLQ